MRGGEAEHADGVTVRQANQKVPALRGQSLRQSLPKRRFDRSTSAVTHRSPLRLMRRSARAAAAFGPSRSAARNRDQSTPITATWVGFVAHHASQGPKPFLGRDGSESTGSDALLHAVAYCGHADLTPGPPVDAEGGEARRAPRVGQRIEERVGRGVVRLARASRASMPLRRRGRRSRAGRCV